MRTKIRMNDPLATFEAVAEECFNECRYIPVSPQQVGALRKCADHDGNLPRVGWQTPIYWYVKGDMVVRVVLMNLAGTYYIDAYWSNKNGN